MPGKPWRRVWHLVGGSFFPVLAFFIAQELVITTLGVITAVFVIWEIIRLSAPGVNHRMVAHLGGILKETERFRPTGSTYLLLASLAVFLLFEKYVAITSLLFLSIGDLMAAVIGEKFGKGRVFNKSREGSLACLASCLLVGVVMTRVSRVMALPAAIVGAVSATLVELLPIPIDDNFTIPLSSAGTMTLTTLYSG